MYNRHPLSNLFEQYDMKGQDFDGLAEDIKKHGLRFPIVTHNNMILDGWNRYMACQSLGLEFDPETLPADEDPWAFVLSANKHRRHMTASQLGAVYLAKQELTGVQFCTPTPSVRSIQKETGLSHGTAQSVASLIKNGAKETKAAAISGKVALAEAAKIAKIPKEEQAAAVKDVINKPKKKPNKELINGRVIDNNHTPEPNDYTETDRLRDELHAVIDLKDELIDQIAKETYSGELPGLPELYDKLKLDYKNLKINYDTIKAIHDGKINENAELKRMCASLRKKLEKLEK